MFRIKKATYLGSGVTSYDIDFDYTSEPWAVELEKKFLKWELRKMKCPGQDMRDWKPGDIFEITCPWCAIGKVEFFKDEPRLKCPNCGLPVKNPKVATGCLEYCPFAEECIGVQRDVDKS